MSSPASDCKKRPPPIAIPEWPPSWTAPAREASINAALHTRGSHQHAQRFASSSTQQAVRSGTTTPLTSPLELDDVRLAIPNSGSHSSRHRTSARTTLSGIMDQARGSPRKSDDGSLPGRHRSSARSQQSERNHRTAAAAQAQLEALQDDERTTRSQIESRTERKLFKMTGQVPPTPTTGPIDPERVFIRTEDLRAQCRAASGEKQPGGDEPARSPKKKLLGVTLPTFSRTTATCTPPAMPLKAAQILGTTPSRKPRRIEPRPIKSTRVLKTPTKAPRSDTAKSLPAKVYGNMATAKIHHVASTRRRRMTGRRSPGKENTPPQKQVAAPSSLEPTSPPTPPAKDTPPDLRLPKNPPSPLRRAPSCEDLRESYGDHPDRGVQVHLPFPIFALSPSPQKTAVHGTGGVSPTKFRPYTAEDYTKLIEGEAMHWPYSEDDTGCEVKEGGRSAPLVAERCDLLQLPVSSRSEDKHYNERLGRRLSPLPPRFYSPSVRSIRLLEDDESPSHNTDTSRLLFAPSLPGLPNKQSHIGLIEMAYQSSMNPVDSAFSEPQTTVNDKTQTQGKQILQQRDGAGYAGSIEQELPMEEQSKQPLSKDNNPGHLEADTPSRQTDVLNNPTSRTESKGDFRVLHPSAVPSPLHRTHGPYVPMPPVPMLRSGPGPALGPAPAGPWPSPRTNKTIEDHFFMTNEHLDVVGKTTYDALDMYTKQQISATNASHDQLSVILDDHINGLKAQISSINDKADDTSSHTHNVGLKVDQLEKFLKDQVFTAVTGQAKKAAEIQSSLKELQSTVTQMQQVMEKLSTTGSSPHPPASSTLSVSGGSTYMPQAGPNHHSQPALDSHYGNEIRRDEQPPTPSVQDRVFSNNYDSHGDTRANYGTNWQSQAWNGRQSYHGRNKGDGSSYAGANPYHLGNGNQYNNGYMSGYSSYNFSPTGSEQPYAYGQKPTQ
ncbi:hypothetical protein SVAN01_11288 [Stagonosporopsis vannaccii]|nr:hypothetical protein SVAN01_11288 [Stagonosporopsis vannaccii]